MWRGCRIFAFSFWHCITKGFADKPVWSMKILHFQMGIVQKLFKLSSTAARFRLEVFPHQIKIWALLDNWWKRHITLERDSPSSMHNQNHTTAPTQMHWMLLQRSWSPNHLFCFFLRAFDQEYLPTQNNLLFKIRSEQIHS